MIKSSKCPKCEKIMLTVRAEEIDVSVSLRPQWKGVVYSCPHCHTAISVQIDPIILHNEIAAMIKETLGKK